MDTNRQIYQEKQHMNKRNIDMRFSTLKVQALKNTITALKNITERFKSMVNQVKELIIPETVNENYLFSLDNI